MTPCAHVVGGLRDLADVLPDSGIGAAQAHHRKSPLPPLPLCHRESGAYRVHMRGPPPRLSLVLTDRVHHLQAVPGPPRLGL